MAVDRLRVGLIGANVNYGWAPRAHLPALTALPDIDLVAHRSRLERIPLTLVVGTRDGYIDEASLQRETDRLVKASLPHRVVRFEGGHRLDSETLSRLAETS